ncbi:MAG TPA: RsmE family RNA methyltransferase [Opitutaceae bacterium]|nr:RsmE family RNA methyltransferase [Opitutaceae bacterium]
MNLILFDAHELTGVLPRSDPRAEHVLSVLRRQPGDLFDVGVVNGPRGKGRLESVSDGLLTLSFSWGAPLPSLPSLRVCLGLPRPQTARKILQELTTLGASELHFVTTERGEPQYAQSTLWSSGEWRRHVLAGAAQAFDTRIPEVTWGRSLADVVAIVGRRSGSEGAETVSKTLACWALDNYEAAGPLSGVTMQSSTSVTLALGPERGWGPTDRKVLRDHGFQLVHLGERVLRAETAAVAALAIMAAKRGLM